MYLTKHEADSAAQLRHRLERLTYADSRLRLWSIRQKLKTAHAITRMRSQAIAEIPDELLYGVDKTGALVGVLFQGPFDSIDAISFGADRITVPDGVSAQYRSDVLMTMHGEGGKPLTNVREIRYPVGDLQPIWAEGAIIALGGTP